MLVNPQWTQLLMLPGFLWSNNIKVHHNGNEGCVLMVYCGLNNIQLKNDWTSFLSHVQSSHISFSIKDSLLYFVQFLFLIGSPLGVFLFFCYGEFQHFVVSVGMLFTHSY